MSPPNAQQILADMGYADLALAVAIGLALAVSVFYELSK